MSDHKVYDYAFDHDTAGTITISVVGYSSWSMEQFDEAAYDMMDDLVRRPGKWTLNDRWETT